MQDFKEWQHEEDPSYYSKQPQMTEVTSRIHIELNKYRRSIAYRALIMLNKLPISELRVEMLGYLTTADVERIASTEPVGSTGSEKDGTATQTTNLTDKRMRSCPDDANDGNSGSSRKPKSLY